MATKESLDLSEPWGGAHENTPLRWRNAIILILTRFGKGANMGV